MYWGEEGIGEVNRDKMRDADVNPTCSVAVCCSML